MISDASVRANEDRVSPWKLTVTTDEAIVKMQLMASADIFTLAPIKNTHYLFRGTDKQSISSMPKKVTQSKTEMRSGPSSRAKVDVCETVEECRQNGTQPTHDSQKNERAKVRKADEKETAAIGENHSSKKVLNSNPSEEKTITGSKKTPSAGPFVRVDGRLVKDELDFLKALHKGELGAVKKFLAKGIDVNAPCAGKSLLPLYIAGKRGRVKVVKLLIERNASVDGISGKGGTALHAAAAGGSLGAIKVLLEHKANVNAVNQSGKTPLHMAAKNANINAMEILLEAGADANILANACTPLDLVIEKVESEGESYLDKARLLIAHGATLTHWEPEKLIEKCSSAITNGLRGLAEIYLNCGCDPNGYIQAEQQTLLGVAAKFGHVEIGELLLDRGASPCTEPSPVPLALQHNHPRFLDLLLKRTAPDSLSEMQKEKCLRIATLEAEMDVESRKEMVRVLLQNGINIDAPIDVSFNTVLHAAVQNDNLELIQMLVDLGADVNAQDRDGLTPLVLACRNSSLAAARIFIRSGKARLSRGTNTGSHPLLEAVENEHRELVKELLISGAPVNLPRNDLVTPLKLAVKKSDEEIVKMLLVAGADVHYRAESLLIDAIMSCKLDVVRLLLRAGIDVTKEDTDEPEADPSEVRATGRAPLMFAVQKGSFYTIIETLLQAGAPVNAVDSEGNTVLHVAASKAQTDLVCILLSYGANSSIRNVSGMTARDIAAYRRFSETVEALDIHESSLRSKDDHESSSAGRSSPDSNLIRQFLTVVEDTFLCLITHEVMHDPVFAPDGHSYERSVITAWIKRKGCSPMTRQEIGVGDLIPNFALKRQIEACTKASPRQFLTDVEDSYLCPITHEIMRDPVFAPDGHSYERSAITAWIETEGCSPMNQQEMGVGDLIPNFALKRQIEAYSKAFLEGC